jgi:hypothetical protein
VAVPPLPLLDSNDVMVAHRLRTSLKATADQLRRLSPGKRGPGREGLSEIATLVGRLRGRTADECAAEVIIAGLITTSDLERAGSLWAPQKPTLSDGKGLVIERVRQARVRLDPAAQTRRTKTPAK